MGDEHGYLVDACCSTDDVLMGETRILPREASKTALERREGLCNTLFFMTAGFGFDHLDGHIALAAWTDLRAMPAAPFLPFIECTYSVLALCLHLPLRES